MFGKDRIEYLAEGILSLVKSRIIPEKIKGKSIIQQPCCNGRENGYCIQIFSKKEFKRIMFSEYRNSDEIGIYVGTKNTLNNELTEEEYKNKKFFNYNDYNGAIEYIIAEILN